MMKRTSRSICKILMLTAAGTGTLHASACRMSDFSDAAASGAAGFVKETINGLLGALFPLEEIITSNVGDEDG